MEAASRGGVRRGSKRLFASLAQLLLLLDLPYLFFLHFALFAQAYGSGRGTTNRAMDFRVFRYPPPALHKPDHRFHLKKYKLAHRPRPWVWKTSAQSLSLAAGYKPYLITSMASPPSSSSTVSDFMSAGSTGGFLSSNIEDKIIMEELMMKKAEPCDHGGVEESGYGPCKINKEYLPPVALLGKPAKSYALEVSQEYTNGRLIIGAEILKNHQYFEAYRVNNRLTLNLVYETIKFPGSVESLEQATSVCTVNQ
ncbi:hypothetical protein GH714_020911 [Hevea brasiliensis]|uniref:Uncharacterized protein n=1 Tax=Hevea brasiliensis TaxID=3981 RepID=A0A6A6LZ67_HEVBR|nr:hypothetical protein GH714_020911 [Hevea brasiliensis]